MMEIGEGRLAGICSERQHDRSLDLKGQTKTFPQWFNCTLEID